MKGESSIFALSEVAIALCFVQVKEAKRSVYFQDQHRSPKGDDYNAYGFSMRHDRG